MCVHMVLWRRAWKVMGRIFMAINHQISKGIVWVFNKGWKKRSLASGWWLIVDNGINNDWESRVRDQLRETIRFDLGLMDFLKLGR